MSLSRSAIAKSHTLLVAAGFRQPKDWADEQAHAASVAVWQHILADVSDSELIELTLVHIRQTTEPWWPVPGALLQHRDIDIGGDWGMWWEAVCDALRRLGAASPPAQDWAPGAPHRADVKAAAGAEWVFSRSRVEHDAVLAGIQAMGGWRLAARSRENDVAHRAAFRSAYQSARRSQVRQHEHAVAQRVLEHGVSQALLPG